MAGSVGYRPGGIFSLCRLIERFGEAIEFDLLTTAGRSLDELGESLSWRDLWVLVMRWQKTAGTATSEAIHGVVHWSTADQLNAMLVDLIAFGNWQRAGRKNAPKPKRLTRPWEKKRAQKFGSNPIPISKFNDWWDSKRKAATHGRRRRAGNSVDPSRTDG